MFSKIYNAIKSWGFGLDLVYGFLLKVSEYLWTALCVSLAVLLFTVVGTLTFVLFLVILPFAIFLFIVYILLALSVSSI